MIVIKWLFLFGLILAPTLQLLLIFFPRKWLIKDAQIAAFHQKSMHALPKWHLLNSKGKVFMVLWWSSGAMVLLGLAIMEFYGEANTFPWN